MGKVGGGVKKKGYRQPAKGKKFKYKLTPPIISISEEDPELAPPKIFDTTVINVIGPYKPKGKRFFNIGKNDEDSGEEIDPEASDSGEEIDPEASDSEEEEEVEIWRWKEKNYYLNPENGNVYDISSQDLLGKRGEGKFSTGAARAPVPPTKEPTEQQRIDLIERNSLIERLITEGKTGELQEILRRIKADPKKTGVEHYEDMKQEIRDRDAEEDTGAGAGAGSSVDPESLPVKSFKYDDIVATGEELGEEDEDLVSLAESNWMDSGSSDVSWIRGITASQAKFFEENSFHDPDLTKKERDRYETIEEKIRDGLYLSLNTELKRSFRDWKANNINKRMNPKQARLSFEKYYGF